MIYWLVQSLAECPSETSSWLSAAEVRRLAALTNPKRRREWLLGRWTAKRLLQRLLLAETRHEFPLAAITIASGPNGAPEAHLASAGAPVSGHHRLTLSHSGEYALCAASLSDGGQPLGADIEQVAPRSPSFVEDFFTPAEAAQVHAQPAAERDQAITVIWSAKEAALKAVRLGLTVDARAVNCWLEAAPPLGQPWRPVRLTWERRFLAADPPPVYGWWRPWGGAVMTLVAERPGVVFRHGGGLSEGLAAPEAERGVE